MYVKRKANSTFGTPKAIQEGTQLTLYQLERLTYYPEQKISHWIANPQSSRYIEPTDAVKHHFGLLHLTLMGESA